MENIMIKYLYLKFKTRNTNIYRDEDSRNKCNWSENIT